MRLFIIPLLVMVLVQTIKLLLEAARGNFSWEHLNNYGGMPSAHAALASSLVTMLYIDSGWDSGAFAVAIILFFIVVRDATGFRRQLGLHAKLINMVVKDLDRAKEYKYPVLNERLGHTPWQVTVGTLSGVAITYLLTMFLPYF
jgi:acid phosphatase family membrane protein YuiD